MTAPTFTPLTTPDPHVEAADVDRRAAARLAGSGYVAIFFLAIFANFVVREGLIDSDDPARTVANIAGSTTLFRAGVIAFVAVFLLDIAVSFGLFVVFHPAGRRRSLHAAWFRLAHTVFLGVGAAVLMLALRLAMDVDGQADPDGLGRMVLLAVDLFDDIWLIGLAAFGIHLVLVGRLILTSGIAPRGLGLVLTAAGVAYVLDTTAQFLLASYADWENLFLASVVIPSVLGEAALTVWLLRAGFGGREAGRTAGRLP
jgi:hypothetical protein